MPFDRSPMEDRSHLFKVTILQKPALRTVIQGVPINPPFFVALEGHIKPGRKYQALATVPYRNVVGGKRASPDFDGTEAIAAEGSREDGLTGRIIFRFRSLKISELGQNTITIAVLEGKRERDTVDCPDFRSSTQFALCGADDVEFNVWPQ